MLKLELPIRTVSEANSREHWRAKNARKTAQQTEVRAEWLKAIRKRNVYLQTPYAVRLTRLGPRKLDDDNLRSAFKGIRDEVARLLGVDDGSDLIRFEYGQEKVSRWFGVRIEVV
jgi:hypothetical protein